LYLILRSTEKTIFSEHPASHFLESTPPAYQTIRTNEHLSCGIFDDVADSAGLFPVSFHDLHKFIGITFGHNGAESDAHVEDSEHLVIGDIAGLLDQGEYRWYLSIASTTSRT